MEGHTVSVVGVEVVGAGSRIYHFHSEVCLNTDMLEGIKKGIVFSMTHQFFPAARDQESE